MEYEDFVDYCYKLSKSGDLEALDFAFKEFLQHKNKMLSFDSLDRELVLRGAASNGYKDILQYILQETEFSTKSLQRIGTSIASNNHLESLKFLLEIKPEFKDPKILEEFLKSASSFASRDTVNYLLDHYLNTQDMVNYVFVDLCYQNRDWALTFFKERKIDKTPFYGGICISFLENNTIFYDFFYSELIDKKELYKTFLENKENIMDKRFTQHLENEVKLIKILDSYLLSEKLESNLNISLSQRKSKI